MQDERSDAEELAQRDMACYQDAEGGCGEFLPENLRILPPRRDEFSGTGLKMQFSLE